MISDGPPHTSANRAFTSGVTVDLEVPDAGWGSDNELASTHDKGINPEEHEDLVEHDVTGVVFPFDVSEELVIRSRVRFSYRVDVEGTDDPAEKPDKSN